MIKCKSLADRKEKGGENSQETWYDKLYNHEQINFLQKGK